MLDLAVASGGAYCRVPHRRDLSQTQVADQERMCRAAAAAADIPLSSRHVFVDHQRTAWHRDGRRPGWTGLLTALACRDISTLMLFGPGALSRFSPQDAVRLLDDCEEYRITLRSLGDEWNLADPLQLGRYRERTELAGHVAAAVGIRAGKAHEEAAAGGRPHGGGRRPFGYLPGMQGLAENEASIVREIFTRFLAGESLRALAFDLNARGVRNSGGGQWSGGGVARVIDAPRYAGLRVFRGQIARGEDGGYLIAAWPPCVTPQEWEQAQILRTQAQAERARRHATPGEYPLTGLLICGGCGHHMVGTDVGGYRMYACASSGQAVPNRCTRHIGAEPLERHVDERAIVILEAWDAASGPDFAIAARRGGARDADPHGEVIVRSAAALDGVVTGPRARTDWHSVPSQRRAAVFRVLFTSIVIGPKSTSRNVFDTGRVRFMLDPAVAPAVGPQD